MALPAAAQVAAEAVVSDVVAAAEGHEARDAAAAVGACENSDDRAGDTAGAFARCSHGDDTGDDILADHSLGLGEDSGKAVDDTFGVAVAGMDGAPVRDSHPQPCNP